MSWALLDKLRAKPKATKNRYALVTAATFTVLVAVLWFTSGAAIRDSALVQSSQGDYPNPFSSLTKELSSQWATLRQAFILEDEAAMSSPNTVAPTGSPPAVPDIVLDDSDLATARERINRVGQGEGTFTFATTGREVVEREEVMIITSSERQSASGTE